MAFFDLKRQKIWNFSALIFYIFMSFGAARKASAQSNEHQKGKHVSVGFVGGIPQFLAAEVAYVGLPRVALSVSFGSFPINSILNGALKLSPQYLTSVAGNSFSLVPSANYSLYGTTLNARVHPFQGGFFTQFDYSHWTFNGSISLGLRNDSTNSVTGGIASANGTLTLSSVGLSLGYQLAFSFGLYFNFGIGVSTWVVTSGTLSAGGTAASLASLLGGTAVDISGAVSGINTQLNQGLAQARSVLPVFPNLFIGTGWSF